MASYQTANFNLQSQSIAGRKQWTYEDTGPVGDVAEVSGFIADAKNKGVEAGDLVFYTDTTRLEVYTMMVTAVQDTGATTGSLGLQLLVGDTS